MTPTVLLVGGAGVFGRHLAEALAASFKGRLLIAGRSLSRAEAVAAPLRQRYGRDDIAACTLDRDSATPAALRGLGATIVVDVAGPFQGADLRFARAAIEAGCHFIDLADARDYVAAFPQLDALARAHGVLAVTGASSTPALSNAVLDTMAAGISTIRDVVVAIAPGNRAPRGLSVLQAILSYVGRPVPLRLAGRQTARAGWSLLQRRDFPGIGPRWLSLCETPDLDILAARFPTARNVIFLAGLELAVLHLGLWAAGFLVRWHILRSLVPAARLFLEIARLFERFGSDRGGMLVVMDGHDADGTHRRLQWSLVAAAGAGPNVPILPALALLRKLADGTVDARGARPCIGLLSLPEIEAEFGRRDLSTSRADTSRDPVFVAAMGTAFADMPAAVRALHRPRGVATFSGVAEVDGAGRQIATPIARLLGFPPAGRNVPVSVTLAADESGETWTRRFGDASFTSHIRAAAAPGRIVERFGWLSFTLALRATGDGLSMQVASWSLGRLALPRFAMPYTVATESIDAEGRFRFDVEIGLPWIGRLVRYHGFLVANPLPAGPEGEGGRGAMTSPDAML